mmetsp:Transcript_16795/g.46097  ORF Transcript_16795/g.46097 Transcript_16795/m.46097 type:complete len:81 (+) Transcript_16795:3146-3388(+)
MIRIVIVNVLVVVMAGYLFASDVYNVCGGYCWHGIAKLCWNGWGSGAERCDAMDWEVFESGVSERFTEDFVYRFIAFETV